MGSSAHGVFGNTYVQNYYEQNLYRKALDEGRLPIYRGKLLSNEDLLRRTVINQIRTYFEIRYSDFSNHPDCKDFSEYFQEEILLLREFEKDKLVVFNEVVELTELEHSPQVCEGFDKYGGKPFNIDIPVVVELKVAEDLCFVV